MNEYHSFRSVICNCSRSKWHNFSERNWFLFTLMQLLLNLLTDAVFASKEVDTCPGVKWNLVCNPQCSYQFEKKENDCQCRYTYSDARTNKNYEVTSDAVNCG